MLWSSISGRWSLSFVFAVYLLGCSDTDSEGNAETGVDKFAETGADTSSSLPSKDSSATNDGETGENSNGSGQAQPSSGDEPTDNEDSGGEEADKVDIEALLVSASAESVFETDKLPVRISVANRRPFAVPSFKFEILLAIDPELPNGRQVACGGEIDSISAGEEVERELNCPLNGISPGRYFLILDVDTSYELNEGDESNNRVVSLDPIEIESLPVDLTPLSVEIDEHEVYTNEPLVVRSRIQNLGQSPVDEFRVDYILHPKDGEHEQTCSKIFDVRLEENDVQDLSFACRIDEALKPGEYTLSVEVDSMNEVAEVSEENNTIDYEGYVAVLGHEEADLRVVSVTTSTPSVAVGKYARFSVVVENRGGIDIDSFSSSLHYSRDKVVTREDPELCQIRWDHRLAAGQETTIEKSCEVPYLEGEYYLGVVLDPGNWVSESNEENNTGVTSSRTKIWLDVSEHDFDLQATKVYSSERSFFIGQEDGFFIVYMRNNGNEAINGFSVGVYLSEDPTITRSDFLLVERYYALQAPIRPGEKTNPVIDAPQFPEIAPGEYYVGGILDISDEFFEGDESNNIAVREETIVVRE